MLVWQIIKDYRKIPFNWPKMFNAILFSKFRCGGRTWWQDTAFPSFTITNIKCTFTIICNVFFRQIIKDYRKIPFNWPKMFNAILFSKFRCGGRTWWQDTAFPSFTITNIKCTFTIICNVFFRQIIKDYRQIPFDWPKIFNAINFLNCAEIARDGRTQLFLLSQ